MFGVVLVISLWRLGEAADALGLDLSIRARL
jgi:hypothetical protein